MSNLGDEVSYQTVANVLKRHGLAPAPERGKRMRWRDFIRSHTEVLAAVDLFTAEVLSKMILFPAPVERIGEPSGDIRTRERLGGLLRFYHREAA